MPNLALKSLVKGHKPQIGNHSESRKVGVSPAFRARMLLSRKGAEDAVQIWWFLEEKHPAISEPVIKCLPSLELGHHLISSHNCLSGEEPQQAELREAAETNPCVHLHFFEPGPRDSMVNVPPISQGDPDIHIREKE